ncbi:MAG: S41 family peptidase [Pseudomonadota bacterium]
MVCDRLVFLCSLGFTLLCVSGCREEDKSSQTTEVSVKQTLEVLLPEVLERIRSDYIDNVSEHRLIEGALGGVLMALDPYSLYLDPNDSDELKGISKGEFGGVGLEILPAKTGLKVISAIDGTPAQIASIQAGDLITHINGQDVTKILVSDALRQLYGKPGTDIKLSILEQNGKQRDLTLTRSTIKVNPVKSNVKDKIAYLRISLFNEQCEKEVRNTIDAILREGKLHGLIIDLRNNPGGILEQAISVTSLFLDGGTIVRVQGRTSHDTQNYEAKDHDHVRGLPIVILINKGSASGSEIFASALKDHKRAIIMGSQSFGKGAVQTLFPLSNNGVLKLTTAYFHSPKNSRIHEKGVEPDIVVEADPKDVMFDPIRDAQLKRAYDLLRGLSFFQVREEQ